MKTNYGTVNELKYQPSAVGDWVITETHYGVQVDNDGAVTLEQKESGQVLDFSQLTKEGYELTGYTQAYKMGDNGVEKLASPITVSGTSYTVTALGTASGCGSGAVARGVRGATSTTSRLISSMIGAGSGQSAA